MLKTAYIKPTLLRREKLAIVTAEVPSGYIAPPPPPPPPSPN